MTSSGQIGNSLFDVPGSEKVAALVEKAKKNNVKIVFPVDYITADKFDKDAEVGEVLSTDQPSASLFIYRPVTLQTKVAFQMAG